MDNTEKVLVGVGVVAAIGVIWYVSTRPKAVAPPVYKVVAPASTTTALQQDIAAASTAATAISKLASGLSASGSDDDPGYSDGDVEGDDYSSGVSGVPLGGY